MATLTLTYKCAECGRIATCNHGVLSRIDENGRNITGEGLGTWRCPQHPYRYVTVTKDLSGGKESNRELRRVPVMVKRHTKVVLS